MVEVLSEAVSYNREFQAVIMNECIESSRVLELSQKMDLLSQNSNTRTPIRKLKCSQKDCKRMEVYSDLKSSLNLMQSSASYTVSQLTGVSGQQRTSFVGGLLSYGDFTKEFKCPEQMLATKFLVNDSLSKDTFVIENKEHSGYYLTVRGCRNGSYISLTKEKGLNTRFYFDGDILRSALCGDGKAVDVRSATCYLYQVIQIWNSHGGDNQRWEFDDDGYLKSKLSSCSEAFFNLDLVPMSFGFGMFLYPKFDYDFLKWRIKDEKKLSIREMTCSDVGTSSGLEVHAADFESSDDYITSSEYGSEQTECPSDYLAAGFECKDTFCNELRLLCKKVEVRQVASAFRS